MGARGLSRTRHVILPALAVLRRGLKQGWAFAWRSLMAGEIIGIVGHQISLGQQIQFAPETFRDAEQLLAILVVISSISASVIDSLFGILDKGSGGVGTLWS